MNNVAVKKSRNASAVIFGFDYQIDASICLFVRNIEKVEEIKVEGKYEDIEQVLNDGSIIYCQVKSVVDPINTTENTKRGKLKKALESLAECPINTNDKLLYCSNQKDILISDSSLFSNNSILEYKYQYLDDASKKIINKYFKNRIEKCNSLSIIKIPYNISEDERTRKAFIYETMKDLLISLSEDPSFCYSICDTWHDYLKNSAYAENPLTKKELVWMLVITLLNTKLDYDDLVDDERILDDVKEKYGDLVLNKLLNFETYNKLQFIYETAKQKDDKKKIRINDVFCENSKEILLTIYCKEECSDIEMATALVIFSSMIKLNSRVKKIKEVCKIEN